jgi:hypothetical protein
LLAEAKRLEQELDDMDESETLELKVHKFKAILERMVKLKSDQGVLAKRADRVDRVLRGGGKVVG